MLAHPPSAAQPSTRRLRRQSKRAKGQSLLFCSLIPLLPCAPGAAWPPITDWPFPGDPEPRASSFHEVFPHVRLDRTARLVEFDARVPINAHAPDGSVVFLEVIACTRDSKEHEALAMTDAAPSHIHAALLLLDLEPGSTGGWRWEGQTLTPIPPEGPALIVSIAWQDTTGEWTQRDALDLVISRADGRTFGQWLTDMLNPGGATDAPSAPFVFAGSRFVQRGGQDFYDADGTGLIVGLHTFSSEVVALTTVLSPEAAVLEPEWIACADLLPPRGTPIVVRLHAAP